MRAELERELQSNAAATLIELQQQGEGEVQYRVSREANSVVFE